MRSKIKAQLETLKAAGILNVVLSAFGCGAFGNPADKFSEIYKELLEEYSENFDEAVFLKKDGGTRASVKSAKEAKIFHQYLTGKGIVVIIMPSWPRWQ